MLLDRQGKEIAVGAIVSWRLTITNEIAGADPINLLAAPENPWPGIPQDQRFALAASYIDVVQPAPSATDSSAAVPTTAAAPPAAPVQQPAAFAAPQAPQPPAAWPQTYTGWR